MNKWKDVTTYSRSDKERKPSAWALKIGKLRITVVRNHIYFRGQWVMHCSPFYNTHPLNVETKEQAQEKAMSLVIDEINKINVAIEQASGY